MSENITKDGSSLNLSHDAAESTERWFCTRLTKTDAVSALLLGLFAFLLSASFYAFDHHQLMMDESWHVLKGYDYKELWSHFRPWKIDWWRRFLSVDGFYPYVVQAQVGLVKTVFGGGRYADIFVSCAYNFLMASSIFLSVRMVGVGVIAAFASVLFINFFPETNQLNHMFMLDFPAMSSTAFGIFLFLWWWQNPSFKRAIVTGFFIGLCSLTKHVAAVFLLGVGLLFVALSAIKEAKIKWTLLTSQIVTLGAVAAGTVIPWIIVNREKIKHINESAREGLSSTGTLPDFSASAFYYLESFWITLSPFLCCVAVLAVFCLRPADHKKMIPFWCSFTVGFVLMSSYVYPMHRYLLPSLILPSVLCGVLTERLFQSRFMLVKALAMAILLLSTAQFVSFHYTPYPISNFPALTLVSKVLGVKYESTKCGADGYKGNPVAYEDWGYDWVARKIASVDKNPVYVNVMVNLSQLNAQTFDLQLKEKKSNIFSTTSRVWNIAGDMVDFDPKTALNFQWYLFKEGNTGMPFRDEKSRKNYLDMKNFVENSGKYNLMEKRLAPDGTELKLYRVV